MHNTHTRSVVLVVAAAGSLAIPAFAQPPARQIPIVRTPTPGQPTTQPSQPTIQPGTQPAAGAPQATAPQGTVPVTIGGQTINVSPSDAANVAAWKDKLRQLAIARGINLVNRGDGAPTYSNTRDYIVPTNGGKGEGIVSVSDRLQIGAWFAGTGGTTNASLDSVAIKRHPAVPANQIDAATPIGQIVGGTPAVQTEIPHLTPQEMTPAAIEAARKQYPTEQGWSEMWLGNGGKLFVKAAPADAVQGLTVIDSAWRTGVDGHGVQSVNDLGTCYKTWSQNCQSHTATVTDQHAWGKSPKSPAEETPKYTIAPDVIPSQIQLIQESQKVIQDDGRLERALAISELQQLPTWKRGVQRLAETYLTHPALATISLSQDFSDLTGEAMRKMTNQIVADANRNTDPKGLVAAATLMVSDRRIEPALNTLSRARRFTTEQSDKDRIDGLFGAINAMPRH